MKQFTFTILFLLITTVVNGLPLIVQRGVPDYESMSCEFPAAAKARRSPRALLATAVNAAKLIAANTNNVISTSKPLLYSGVTGTIHSGKVAGEFRSKNPGYLKIGGVLSNLKVDTKGWEDPEFKHVCAAWTERAEGDAVVILGKTVDAQSTWLTVEKARLLANTKVPNIKVFEVDDKGALEKKPDLKKK
ncbi:hypothetical protein C8J56DRAFT_898179 [Mycena floridula]|nr:hypothetical protein C8J56DRAFT_898179 [Mycena floridula]